MTILPGTGAADGSAGTETEWRLPPSAHRSVSSLVPLEVSRLRRTKSPSRTIRWSERIIPEGGCSPSLQRGTNRSSPSASELIRCTQANSIPGTSGCRTPIRTGTSPHPRPMAWARKPPDRSGRRPSSCPSIEKRRSWSDSRTRRVESESASRDRRGALDSSGPGPCFKKEETSEPSSRNTRTWGE